MNQPRRARNARPKKSAGGRILKIVLTLVVLAVAGYFGIDLTGGGSSENDGAQRETQIADRAPATSSASVPSVDTDDRTAQHAVIARLMLDEQSDTMVTLAARIIKVLPDDNEGSRHQKFLVRIEADNAPEDTVLIAHNIDLAPRVPATEGDDLLIRGEYEYNDLGGVIHWTHHDPGQRREGGWIEHEGERYE